MQKIIHGDCLNEMRKMDNNSIDCVVCDPPYGLSFMQKEWDGNVPSTEYWQECYRICKPGAHLLAFGGSRTHHHLMLALEHAGWEIRDVIMWLYGSGFPKSHNFGRKLDNEWYGFGTALKPAYEPIIMAMKPCDGTFAKNAKKWGVGGINIDDCRIDFQSDAEKEKHANEWVRDWKSTPIHAFDKAIGNHPGEKMEIEVIPKNVTGRWPANIILDEEAAEMLDGQGGILKSGSGIKKPIGGATTGFHTSNWKDSGYKQGDSGGASRFFYCAKTSSSERNAGLEGVPLLDQSIYNEMKGTKDHAKNRSSKIHNNHPTVKPLRLMEYLLKLIMPPNPNAICLDPFAGSGTTILAAKRLGFNAIGIEKETEYVEIANARLNAYEKKPETEQLMLF